MLQHLTSSIFTSFLCFVFLACIGLYALAIFGKVPVVWIRASHSHLVFHGSISLKIKYLQAYEYKCDDFCALDCGIEITQQLQEIMHQALSCRQRQSVQVHHTKSHFPACTCTFLLLCTEFQTTLAPWNLSMSGRRMPPFLGLSCCRTLSKRPPSVGVMALWVHLVYGTKQEAGNSLKIQMARGEMCNNEWRDGGKHLQQVEKISHLWDLFLEGSCKLK